MNNINWLNYWNKKNIWTESDLWKKNNDIFFLKTSHIFNFSKKNIVLDIGCGNGDFTNKVINKVDKIYCVDTSQEYVNICKTRFSNNKNVTVLKLGNNYTDLSFIKDIKFSIIIANAVKQQYYPILFTLCRAVYYFKRGFDHLRFMDFSFLPGKPGYFLWKIGIIHLWRRFFLKRYNLPKKSLEMDQDKSIN